MKEPLLFKIQCFIERIINKISGKKYSCCNKLFVNCDNCWYDRAWGRIK